MILQETAYAKLNLALHVRARMPDGYHRIETLFAFCEDGDILHASDAEEISLRIEGPFAHGLDAGETNLVMRAARAFALAAGFSRGAAITLDKRLPVASGIGGGSADAAATLRLLSRLWDVVLPEHRLFEIAKDLGADVPACLRSRVVRGDGRGDALRHVAEPMRGHVLLVNSGLHVSTAAVFGAWKGVDRGAMPNDPAFARNDLQVPATALCPEIAEVLARLGEARDARLVRMSGSGATCFALFDDEDAAQAADARIAAAAPRWWRLRSRLR